jgi:imidazolonepropionase-like amidohydrolase
MKAGFQSFSEGTAASSMAATIPPPQRRWKAGNSVFIWSLAGLAFVAVLFAALRFYPEWVPGMPGFRRTVEALLIRDVRVILGPGEVLERGSVLLRGGKIEAVWADGELGVEATDARIVPGAGGTLLPGLVDTFTLPLASAEWFGHDGDDPGEALRRFLRAQLYCGVTAVRALDLPDLSTAALGAGSSRGTFRGAELFRAAPLGTTAMFEGSGFSGSKVKPDGPTTHTLVVSLPSQPRRAYAAMLRVQAARATGTGTHLLGFVQSAAGLSLGLDIGVGEVAFSRWVDLPSEGQLAEMAARGIQLSIPLGWHEILEAQRRRDPAPLGGALAEDIAGRGRMDAFRRAVLTGEAAVPFELPPDTDALAEAADTIRLARRAGVPLSCGSHAGRPFVLPGASLHRELELRVAVGVPPVEALGAVTWEAARLFGAGDRFGRIEPGYEANLLLVDGNPLADIRAVSAIKAVIQRGELVAREALLSD